MGMYAKCLSGVSDLELKCGCPKGWKLAPDGRNEVCVPVDTCQEILGDQSKLCGANSKYSVCPYDCPPTTSCRYAMDILNGQPAIACSMLPGCRPGCVCEYEEYVASNPYGQIYLNAWRKNPNFSGRKDENGEFLEPQCIRIDECYQQSCGEFATFSRCSDEPKAPCRQEYCDKFGNYVFNESRCKACTRGCKCNEGYIRDDFTGECVPFTGECMKRENHIGIVNEKLEGYQVCSVAVGELTANLASFTGLSTIRQEVTAYNCQVITSRCKKKGSNDKVMKKCGKNINKCHKGSNKGLNCDRKLENLITKMKCDDDPHCFLAGKNLIWVSFHDNKCEYAIHSRKVKKVRANNSCKCVKKLTAKVKSSKKVKVLGDQDIHGKVAKIVGCLPPPPPV